MTLDDQLRAYFGTNDLSSLTPNVITAGIERIQVDFGLEEDSSRRFALWALLLMLGGAPDLDVAFKDEGERNAARNMLDMMDQAEKAAQDENEAPTQ